MPRPLQQATRDIGCLQRGDQARVRQDRAVGAPVEDHSQSGLPGWMITCETSTSRIIGSAWLYSSSAWPNDPLVQPLLLEDLTMGSYDVE
jgi:hypothetical protein